MRLDSPVYSGFSWSWGDWQVACDGRASWRPMNDIWATVLGQCSLGQSCGQGGMFSLQGLVQLCEKRNLGKASNTQITLQAQDQWWHSLFSTPSCLTLPCQHCLNLLIIKTKQKFSPTTSLHVITQAPSRKNTRTNSENSRVIRFVTCLVTCSGRNLGLVPTGWCHEG